MKKTKEILDYLDLKLKIKQEEIERLNKENWPQVAVILQATADEIKEIIKFIS